MSKVKDDLQRTKHLFIPCKCAFLNLPSIHFKNRSTDLPSINLLILLKCTFIHQPNLHLFIKYTSKTESLTE